MSLGYCMHYITFDFMMLGHTRSRHILLQTKVIRSKPTRMYLQIFGFTYIHGYLKKWARKLAIVVVRMLCSAQEVIVWLGFPSAKARASRENFEFQTQQQLAFEASLLAGLCVARSATAENCCWCSTAILKMKSIKTASRFSVLNTLFQTQLGDDRNHGLFHKH